MAAGLLLLSPIVRGGNRQVALVALLALALALMAVLLAQRTFQRLPAPSTLALRQDFAAERAKTEPVWWWLLVGLLASSPLWIGAIQLVPVDSGFWAGIAGRQPYLDALAATGTGLPTTLPLSLNPSATWTAMWSALPASAVFLAALLLDRKAIDSLLLVLFAAAITQVVIAVLQFAGGAQSFFYFGSPYASGFIGSFNNRNHLADFLAMLIPVWFYFLVRRSASGNQESTWLPASVFRPLWMLLGFSFLVIILSSQSRGGLSAVTIVLLLSFVLYVASAREHLSKLQIAGMAALLIVFGLVVAFSVGLEGISSRVAEPVLRSDAGLRNAYALATYDAAGVFWPWGSGIGSYEAVFPRFQDLQATGFIEYAHNDYPQLLMELGFAAVLVGGLLVVLVLLQLVRLFKAGRRRGELATAVLLRLLAGVGALALLMHSWVEFNMHIPSLAMTAAFLMGIFLRPVDPHQR